MRDRLGRPVRAAFLACIVIGWPPAAAEPRGPRLRPLTRTDLVRAGTIDVGCYWSLPGEASVRFAAADDRAAVRLGRSVPLLRPAPGAKDMFPFTYDAWATGPLRISVRGRGPGKRKGGVVVRRASLTIRSGDVVRRVDGVLECGG